MAKRFTASDKWEDAWFRTLSPKSKLFWLFLLDRCDGAGFWKTDYALASFCIGEQIAESILADFEGRIEPVNGDKLWIVRFVEFQYGVLKEGVNAHKPVIKMLAKYSLLQRVEEGFLIPSVSHPHPFRMGCLRDQDKDKDKNQDKDKDQDQDEVQ